MNTEAKNVYGRNESFFHCKTCKKKHEFGVYVAAHTHVELTHTCDRCGAKHSVINYLVTQTEPGLLSEAKP